MSQLLGRQAEKTRSPTLVLAGERDGLPGGRHQARSRSPRYRRPSRAAAGGGSNKEVPHRPPGRTPIVRFALPSRPAPLEPSASREHAGLIPKHHTSSPWDGIGCLIALTSRVGVGHRVERPLRSSPPSLVLILSIARLGQQPARTLLTPRLGFQGELGLNRQSKPASCEVRSPGRFERSIPMTRELAPRPSMSGVPLRASEVHDAAPPDVR